MKYFDWKFPTYWNISIANSFTIELEINDFEKQNKTFIMVGQWLWGGRGGGGQWGWWFVERELVIDSIPSKVEKGSLALKNSHVHIMWLLLLAIDQKN